MTARNGNRGAPPGRGPRRGFTLIELMLAVLVLAIMMALVYGVVVSTVQAAQRVEQITLGTEVGPAILTRLREDLEAAFVPTKDGDFFAGYDRKASGGDRDRVDLVSSVMAYGAERDGEEPLFHGVNEVGYQLIDSRRDPSVGILYRREDYFLDADPVKGGRLTELYDRVRHFNVEFWDGETWRQDWSSRREKGKLPAAVRIELKILVEDRDDRDVERSFSTIVTYPR